MNKPTIRFMLFDLMFLSFLSAISEWMGSGLLKLWSSSFYFSFAIVIGMIATIRWGKYGIVVGMAGGIPGIFFSEMPLLSGILFYVIANAFLGIPILLYGERNRDQISSHPILLSSYVFLCHVCLAVGKGIVIFLLTGEHTGMIDYFGATFLILVINIVVCLVLKTREGLLCDMRYYFRETEGEENERQGN